MVANALRELPLFRTLSRAQRTALAAASRIEHYPADTVIFSEGDRADTVWVILDGWVTLTKRVPHAGPVMVCTLTAEEALCGFSAFEPEAAYAMTAMAAANSRLIAIRADAFVALFGRAPAFAREVLRLCCRRVRRLAEASALGHAPVPERIAATLLRLSHACGPTVPITHHRLAALAGTRWETSIRTIANLKRRGLVETARGRVTILSAAGLAALLNGHTASAASSAGIVHTSAR
jgi:CRP-like cAMP-binding protein